MIDLDVEAGSATHKSKHEQSKGRRRLAIVAAARDIIRETGETGLSMRALAARAGVSLATPYNLFGSKQAVLIALLNSEAVAFEKIVHAKASPDKLSRIFDFVDANFNHYHSDPEYFRVLLRSLYRSEDAHLRARLQTPNARFIEPLIRDAVAARYLQSQPPVHMLSRQLLRILLYVIQEWVHATITLDRAKLEVGLGYALVLLAVATEQSKPRLLGRVDRLRSAIDADEQLNSRKRRGSRSRRNTPRR